MRQRRLPIVEGNAICELRYQIARFASYTLSHASKSSRMRTYAKKGRGVGRAKVYVSRVSKVGGVCLASATSTHPYKRPFTAPFRTQGKQGKRVGHPETRDGCIRAATRCVR